MPNRTTSDIVNPGVVMHINPSSRPDTTTAGCSSVTLAGDAIENVRSPDETTLITKC